MPTETQEKDRRALIRIDSVLGQDIDDSVKLSIIKELVIRAL